MKVRALSQPYVSRYVAWRNLERFVVFLGGGCAAIDTASVVCDYIVP